MSQPIIEALSAATIVLAIAVAAIVIPAPRFKPQVPQDLPVVEDNAPVSQVVPAPPPPEIEDEERVHVIEDEVRAARDDLEEIKAILKEKVEKQNDRREP